MSSTNGKFLEILGFEITNFRDGLDREFIDRAWLDDDWKNMRQGIDGYPKTGDFGY